LKKEVYLSLPVISLNQLNKRLPITENHINLIARNDLIEKLENIIEGLFIKKEAYKIIKVFGSKGFGKSCLLVQYFYRKIIDDK
jgi:hypothetical protein